MSSGDSIRPHAPSTNGHPPEATIEWMTKDIVGRCRDVIGALEIATVTAAQLGDAATALCAAADDLVALVKLVEGPHPVDGRDLKDDDDVPFNLSFRDALRRNGHD